jgi:3-hydroxyacyl-CoA dehydrogenase
MICGSERIDAAEALGIGLVDAVAQGDLLQAATAFLKGEARAKRVARLITPPAEDDAEIEAATALAVRRGGGRPNVAEAIRLIKASAGGDLGAALAEERAVFQDLRVGADAFALRYLFFAERRAAVLDGLDQASARRIETVGIVGGGTMGKGIARATLAAGLAVVLVERDADTLSRALAAIAETLDSQEAKGRLDNSEKAARLAALAGAVGTADLAGCGLVIEAVLEDLEIKRQLLSEIERVVSADTPIATNTSYLDIDAMAHGLAHPERVLGLHFFSPADLMRLLEIVRAEATTASVLATGLAFAKRLGKQPVVAGVADGFIGNRLYAAYRRRAELLVLDGAEPQQVDEAAVAFGFAMGPFAVSDMSGLDIAWAMRKRQAVTRDPRARYVTIPDSLCETGRLGRKTGSGWYDYASGTARPDSAVAEIITRARAEAKIVPTTYNTETIQRQLVAALVNEAACLLDDGVAQRLSDVDVAFVNGYGFPRWRGGPLYWAAHQDGETLAADLDALSGAVGHGYRAGPVRAILAQLELDRG